MQYRHTIYARRTFAVAVILAIACAIGFLAGRNDSRTSVAVPPQATATPRAVTDAHTP
jgi:hypothetical protein